MTRFYGNAVFEGSEVSDEDYEQLEEQRRYEESEIARAIEWAINRILELERWAEEAIAEQERWRDNSIAEQERWRDDSITWIRENTQATVDSIIGAVRIESVYEVCGEATACKLCKTKIGEIGTMDMLAAKDCVPPFHANCKCWLEEIGYCVL